MATTEHTINDALAELLRAKRSVWGAANVLSSENTGMLKDSNARPDILVREPNVSPVVVETEVLPATTVEPEARARLGQKIRTTGRTILSAIAVRLPVRLRELTASKLSKELTAATDVELALFTGSSATEAIRWPRSGWVLGTLDDLAILVQSASVPPDVIEAAADHLVSGVSEVAGQLHEMATQHSGAIHKISVQLCQEDGEQTRRMAATILANAFVFQETLAGGDGPLAMVKSLDELRAEDGGLSKAAILGEWRKILKVNYWPIFDIARRILEVIPAPESKPVLEQLAATANLLLENRLMRSHDLTGAVFQRLIADRKFLAAYYTTPASAALLVGLAISSDRPLSSAKWKSPDAVRKLRIADFACGTGTLLSTAYQRIGQLHELAGGDSESLHPYMMATALIGCDVLPAAAHLTASMLSGAHPTQKYKQSSIMTVAYGRQADGSIALGSLDLLDPQRRFEILALTAKAAEGLGESEKEIWASLPHASFDVVIMNPPFTRATGHEGKKIGIPNPMFAAFSSSEQEQRLMGAATKRLTEGTSAHGNAGEASIFLVLADRKLKADGTLALVMPLSLMSGDAWEGSRALLAKNYADLVVVSIAGTDGADVSFSADTDMGECLVVGRKGDKASKRATFVVLKERPAYPMLGAGVARQIKRLAAEQKLRRLEDGPVGGTSISFGDDKVGQVIDAPISPTGGWNLSRIADLSLAQTAFQLVKENRVWLPSMTKAKSQTIAIVEVQQIGKIGPYHMDINAKTATGGVRGPFRIEAVGPDAAPTYPVLWEHVAGRERSISFPGDSEGVPLKGKNKHEQHIIDTKAADLLATASHCHFNRDFRFNSQSTSMQFTPMRTIGGRAWLSISLKNEQCEKALVLWANTSMGLLLHWWHANKQQAGRGSIGKSSLQALPVLDVTSLSSTQLKAATKLFDKMKEDEMLPFHEIDSCDIRAKLDRRFARDVLGLDAALYASDGPLELLRRKLAREPSIRGHK